MDNLDLRCQGQLVAENKRLKELLVKIKPELQCRIDHLTHLWPGREVAMGLRHVEFLMKEIDKEIKS